MIEECINIISETGTIFLKTEENENLVISERKYLDYILTFFDSEKKVIKESYLIKDKETLIKILDGILNEFERGRVIESLKELLKSLEMGYHINRKKNNVIKIQFC